jgi:hypothetical protein
MMYLKRLSFEVYDSLARSKELEEKNSRKKTKKILLAREEETEKRRKIEKWLGTQH